METQSKKSFFGTLPGILTGLAALIAAVTGLYVAYHDRGQTGPGPDEYVRPPAASVQLQPAQSSIAIGSSVQLQSYVRDSNGNLLHGRPTHWSCSDNTIASVSQTGVVTGLKAGSVTVKAASEGATGTAAIIVEFALTFTFSPKSAAPGREVELYLSDPVPVTVYFNGRALPKEVLGDGSLLRVTIPRGTDSDGYFELEWEGRRFRATEPLTIIRQQDDKTRFRAPPTSK